ncbi:hypothetical protein TruAng_002141 [Truncatella angustata]|nr:hypothetical protein TruAng_002141 [Truncatella angustata]
MRLPPEIRHKIWLAAIPSPGINFFNVHSFPNDHKGANRSTSPPNLHLDLRRKYNSHNDQDVARYDASVWQARHALRQSCREARLICAIPGDKLIRLTLSIPKRGLFTEAGDGLQRSLTPMEHPAAEHEATVYRQVHVHADDMVVLSVENHSFNIFFEESTVFGPVDDDINLGWSYDPQFRDGISLGIPPGNFCLEMIRGRTGDIEEIAEALFVAATGNDENNDSVRTFGNMMFTSKTMERERLHREFRDKSLRRFWDKYGDCYVAIPWNHDDLAMASQIVKLSPEKETSMRRGYVTSAILKSPKRLVMS